ncbi:MAG: tRNA (cytidine(34)-2'-O)-methyltransferase [Myxococcota bacterium]
MALVHPEIPGNTGNVGRLCAGTNMWLHLVRPLGYELSNKHLRRAGLDYWPHVNLCVHDHLDDLLAIFPPQRLHLFTTKATSRYSDAVYRLGDVLIFGRETRGLDPEFIAAHPSRARLIPKTGSVRSLNLSNACAIGAYEAMRQLDFAPMG